jgi:5-formyltetrahydrofolate cyclo-ligase
VVHGKDELRQTYRRLRDAVPSGEAVAAADAASIHLLALPVIVRARTIAVYAPVHGELSPAPAVRVLRERGARLAYPRVVAADRTLAFHLATGTYGIREPAVAASRVAPGEIDVYLVPGLAFDDSGTRLGWGRGYYDRTLAADGHAARVGFCYQCQVVPMVPSNDDDLPVHYIVTEAGVTTARVPS